MLDFGQTLCIAVFLSTYYQFNYCYSASLTLLSYSPSPPLSFDASRPISHPRTIRTLSTTRRFHVSHLCWTIIYTPSLLIIHLLDHGYSFVAGFERRLCFYFFASLKTLQLRVATQVVTTRFVGLDFLDYSLYEVVSASDTVFFDLLCWCHHAGAVTYIYIMISCQLYNTGQKAQGTLDMSTLSLCEIGASKHRSKIHVLGLKSPPEKRPEIPWNGHYLLALVCYWTGYIAMSFFLLDFFFSSFHYNRCDISVSLRCIILSKLKLQILMGHVSEWKATPVLSVFFLLFSLDSWTGNVS